MRVLAATFADEAAAQDVLARLRERYQLTPLDADIARLGAAGDPSDGRVVLAGRFRESVLAEVTEIIQRAGGSVVAEVDEAKAEHPAHGRQGEETWTH